jgi:hypothetical protein
MNNLVKVQIPILIQDPYLLERQKSDLVEGTFIERAAFFDGPETDRISVLDDNEEFNKLKLRAKYSAPGVWSKNSRTGRYLSSDNINLLKAINEAHKANQLEVELALIEKPEFLQVNTYGIIEKTLDLFEDQNLMGRPLRWYYPDEKLIVYVRAMKREKLNAGYTRASDPPHQRIRFYYKTGVTTLENISTVFACLSRDIVSHETAHAIIDGINPALYDFRVSKHCAAIHEALADLTSLFLSFKSGTLTKEVLWRTRGNLDQASQLTFWGEVFDLIGQKDQRSFLNDSHLDPQVPEEYCGEGDAYRHASVLSGSAFSVFVSMFNLRKKELAVEIGPKDSRRTVWRTKPDPEYSVSGDAMQHVLRRLPLLLYRALDYLPRAEISLADFARAMLLVDRNLFGPSTLSAGLLRNEFLRRKIFRTQQNAVVEWPLPPAEIPSVKQLAEDPKLLNGFIKEYREWLGLPADVVIDLAKNCQWVLPITPPLSRIYFDSTSFNENPQAVLKVFWTCNDDQKIDGKHLTVHVGTTVVFDINSNQIIGRLVCAPPQKNMFVSELVQAAYEEEYEQHRQQIRDDLQFELKAVADEVGAVADHIDRGTHDILIKDGIIEVVGQGISDIRDD